MSAYYNEIEPFCCQVLRKRIKGGDLDGGFVDERDVRTVQTDELLRYRQWHFFAGIGGMPYGLRRAGVPADFPIFTAGFPCQDISVAGQGAGLEGERSGLYWEIPRIAGALRPRWLLLENVPALRNRGADDVLLSLAEIGYAAWPFVVGADDVGAPHRRKRVWIVAYAGCSKRRSEAEGRIDVDHRANAGREEAAGGFEFRGAPVADAQGVGQRESHDAQRAFAREWTRQDASWRSDRTSVAVGVGQANADGAGLEERSRQRGDARREFAPAIRTSWPARPGEPQHEWEYSRTSLPATLLNIWNRVRARYPETLRTAEQKRQAEKAFDLPIGALDGPIDGLPARLVRGHQVASLTAFGNSVVPQVVEMLGRAILSVDAQLRAERSAVGLAQALRSAILLSE